MSFVSPFAKKPLLSFSSQHDRALIAPPPQFATPTSASFGSSMPRRRATTVGRKRGGRKRTGASSVRLTKGRISFRVAGYQGTHKLAPSQLVRYIPLGKLKQAAKRVLSAANAPRKRTRGGRLKKKSPRRRSQGNRRRRRRRN